MRPTFLLGVVLVATALVLTDVLTLERHDACPDEHLPTLIGLPLAHRTSVPWVNSLSGVLYLQGLLVNIACWSVVVTIVAVAMKRMATHPQRQRFLRVVGNGLAVLAFVVIGLFLLGVEWRVQWAPDLPFRCPERTVRFLLLGP